MWKVQQPQNKKELGKDAFEILGRSGHASFNFKNRFMLVYGGIHEVTKELDDLCLYDSKT